MSAGLDANPATERDKQNGAKLPHEKTGCARGKSGRDKEERETPKPAARKKSRTGNPGNPTANREAATPQHATDPAAKTATGETEKMDRPGIAPNVKVRGAALLRRPS